MVGQETGLGELGRDCQRLHRVVREDAQRLEHVLGREQPALRLVGPEDAPDRSVGVVERDHEPVMIPGCRTASVANRLVDDLAGVDPALGLVAWNEVAAGDLEARLEQLGDARKLEHGSPRLFVLVPTGARRWAKQLGALLAELDQDLVESERLLHGLADGVEDRLHRHRLRQLG